MYGHFLTGFFDHSKYISAKHLYQEVFYLLVEIDADFSELSADFLIAAFLVVVFSELVERVFP